MIHIFNRKEILITYDLNVLYKAKDILFKNDIQCLTRSFNTTMGRGRGSPSIISYDFGIRHDFSVEYKVYVHRKDYEKAKYLVG